MKHNPPKAEVTGSNPVGCASLYSLRALRLDRVASVWKGSVWRMSALLALISIAMIGYLYGCKTTDDR
jgi:hypothetical protein